MYPSLGWYFVFEIDFAAALESAPHELHYEFDVDVGVRSERGQYLLGAPADGRMARRPVAPAVALNLFANQQLLRRGLARRDICQLLASLEHCGLVLRALGPFHRRLQLPAPVEW